MNPKIAELVAAAKLRSQQRVQEQVGALTTREPIARTAVEKDPDELDWNEQQLKAITLGKEGCEFVLTGAAGSGKTTTVKALVRSLVQSGLVVPMSTATKVLKAGALSVVFVSFTSRAVRNLIKALPDDLKDNCHTIHGLTEFEPVKIDVENEETGEMEESMRFMPQRHESNPILEVNYCVVDESSMVSVELFQQLKAALPNAKFIFVGDLNQLAPVFGDAILGYKLLELPVVELTHIYRQALESPIIAFAHKILHGKGLTEADIRPLTKEGELTFHSFKKRIEADIACLAVKRWFQGELRDGRYTPEDDIILCPFNKSFGTIELNRAIAQTHGEMRAAEVYEIIAGWEKYYYAVGDKIVYNKLEGTILKIKYNPKYKGYPPRAQSIHMDRWGNSSERVGLAGFDSLDEDYEDDPFAGLDTTAHRVDEEDGDTGRKASASHIITVQLEDGRVHNITKAGDFNDALGWGYAITVHKSQGSQWRKVYLCFHQSHNKMIKRELLYTAVTRAQKELYVLYEPDSRIGAKDGTFYSGVVRQQVKGKTLEDKARYFKGKQDKLNQKSSSTILAGG